MNRTAALRLAPQNKVVTHPQFAAYLNGQHVYPINIEISPSGICQATCQFCFYANTGELGSHRNVMLDPIVLLNLLDDCGVLGVKSVSWTGGGEPTLHPRFNLLAEYAAGVGLEQGLFTNALATPKFDASLFEWIRITMTDRKYNEDAIHLLRPAKTLGFAFNYSGPQDDDYLKLTLGLAERVRADYVQLRPALKFHGETVDITPPDITHPLLHVTDYKFEQAKHKHGYATCEAYHLSPMIWETGEVAVCSYMRKHDGYMLGNLYEKRIKEILDRAPLHVPVIEQCQVCCRLHETNLLIHSSRELQDRNFP